LTRRANQRHGIIIDVVLVVLHAELGKPRPHVIVQADELDALASTIVCPMSSKIQTLAKD
jgi:mRNA-degrading endonuclease toxin of MazEF toxin-antitoxin module